MAWNLKVRYQQSIHFKRNTGSNMTIGAIYFLGDEFVALSDGKISRNDGTTSLDSAEKMRVFEPYYTFATANMGRVKFRKKTFGKWFISYAGTHLLCTETINRFLDIFVKLYADYTNSGQCIEIVEGFAAADTYHDDINIPPNELPEMDGLFIARLLQQAMVESGSEFGGNRYAPDAEFLLFGLEGGSRWKAFKFQYDNTHFQKGDRAKATFESIRSSTLATIGDPSRIDILYSVPDLKDLLERSSINAMEYSYGSKSTQDIQLMTKFPDSPGSYIYDRVIDILPRLVNEGVGGTFRVVYGKYSTIISDVHLPIEGQ